MSLRKHLFVLCLVLVASCAIPGDTTTDFACAHIGRLGKSISKLTYEDCKGIRSFSSCLDVLVQQGRIPIESRRELEKDYWQNDYLFQRLDQSDQITLRLISNGENRQFEHGSGDDIMCDVVILKTGQNRLTINHKEQVRR
jgi:hypothetical protein